MTKGNWWKTVFDKKYLDTYIDTYPPELTEKQVKFLIRELKLTKTKKILDLACGFGRHAIPLSKLGYNITGVDYSKYFIKKATGAAKKVGAKVKFLQKDIRKLNFKNEFNVIYCMFTSFGYFESEGEHLKTLKNVYRGLKNGGEFLLDLPNLRAIEKQVKSYRRLRDGTLQKIFRQESSNDLKVKITSTFNPRGKTMSMKVEWVDENDRKKSYTTKVHLFSEPEIAELLLKAGFKILGVLGDFKGAKFNPKSPRMIVLARK